MHDGESVADAQFVDVTITGEPRSTELTRSRAAPETASLDECLTPVPYGPVASTGGGT